MKITVLLSLLSEFTNVIQPCTHGDIYLEAVQNAQEVIELLVETAIEKGEPLPKRQNFQAIPVLQAAQIEICLMSG